MTSLIRRNPFEEFINLFPRDLFGGDRGDTLSMEWSPRCDVTDVEGAVVIHAELPGVEVKDMEVTVAEGVLTIRGEKTTEKQDEKDNRTYRERFFGSFERSIAVPAGVDEAAITATLKDGVLEVRLPKTEVVKPEARKVEITRP